MEELAPALVGITFFFSVAAVLIFRPLTKRLGDMLTQMQRDRQGARLDQGEIARVHNQMEQMQGRIELLEERLEFTERLLDPGQQPARRLTGEGNTSDIRAARNGRG